MPVSKVLLRLLTIMTTAPGLAVAADFDTQRMATDGEWAILVSPYAWASSLKGNASLAGFDTDVDVPFSEILKHLDFVVMGNIEATNGTWGGYVDLQHARTSQEEEAFANEIGLDIETSRVAVGAFYRAYTYELGGQTVFGRPRTVTIEPTAGLRWNQLKAKVEAFGIRTKKSADWTDPFIGIRVNADLTDRWNLAAEADVGGFGVGSKFTVNAQSYLGYRTTMLGRPTILRAGYRFLSEDYESDDFTGRNKFRWDVSQHGPVVGLTMRF